MEFDRQIRILIIIFSPNKWFLIYKNRFQEIVMVGTVISVVTRSTIQFREVGNIDENQQQIKQKIR